MIPSPRSHEKNSVCFSHHLKLWTRLASVNAAGEPVDARSVAALLTTTAVIDAAVDHAVAVALAAEQVVSRSVADLC